MAHVQFEKILPFLVGNGRIGCLLITLLLYLDNVLKKTMLYLSLYFKSHRQLYYKLLNEVRLTGDWEAWLDFFADAIIQTATQAVNTAQRLLKLSSENGQRINGIKRIASSAHQIHRAMLERPMASPNWIKEKTQLSPATINANLRELENSVSLKRLLVRSVTASIPL